MSVDVEEHFQVSAFESKIEREHWQNIPSRVEYNSDRILGMFKDYDVKATFFVLGWIAERHPNLIRRIHDAGHEIASHGFSHIRATKQTREEFSRDVDRTKKLLEDICGKDVNGFRAASFSIGAQNLWALDVLQEVGYRYSSSIYPIHHDLYGMPNAPRFPFNRGKGSLVEIPVSTVRLFNKNLPCGGGGYFRLLPYAYSSWALRQLSQCERQPAVFYFHPWEIDPEQPRPRGLGLKARVRHYTNLGRMESRLKRLLSDFQWGRFDHIFLDRPASVAEYAVGG